MSAPTRAIGADVVGRIAASHGIGPNVLRAAEADALAQHVETRVRQLVEDASRFAAHNGRRVLTSADISSALRMRQLEPLLGHSAGAATPNPRPLLLDLRAVTRAPLPTAPLEPTLAVHWLAVDGVQPSAAQNPAPSATAKRRRTEAGALSSEQRLYYERVTAAVCGPDEVLRRETLRGLSAGVQQQLVPYFAHFVAAEVPQQVHNLPVLSALMAVAQCLVASEHLDAEAFLHRLLPAILTCCVGRHLGLSPTATTTEDHWAVRAHCAALVGHVCRRYGELYPNVPARITQTLATAFADPRRALTTRYGALTGLSHLGHRAIDLCVAPHLAAHAADLEHELASRSPATRAEAGVLYGALLECAGGAVRRATQKRGRHTTTATATATTTTARIAFEVFGERMAAHAHLLERLASPPTPVRTSAVAKPPRYRPTSDFVLHTLFL